MVNKLIALFDMDDTLVDYMGTIAKDLNKIKHPSEPDYIGHPKKITEYNKYRIDLIRNQKGWWENLPRFQLGFDILEITKELKFKHQILTKGPYRSPNAWTEKFLWSKREVPYATTTITEEKSNINGTVLIDDWFPYLRDWLEYNPRGIAIMPAQPYNKKIKHPKITRYDGTNLDQVKEVLTWAKNKK